MIPKHMPLDGAKKKALVFGASGALGQGIFSMFETRGHQSCGTARKSAGPLVGFDPFDPNFDPSCLDILGPFDAICFAQGANLSDSALDVDLEKHLELYKANCLFVLAGLQLLLERGLLAPKARICVIGSIWQNIAKNRKLSYSMTKSALQGLVLSASVDLAPLGHLINAVLPGAVDTPMTRTNLTAEQLATYQASTGFGRLPTVDDVANSVYFLCSDMNGAATGQFLTVDFGFSHAKYL